MEQRGNRQPNNGNRGVPGNPANPGAEMFAVLSSILGNGRHGDTVFSDEALDRVITQLMDQTNPHSAPGPASTAAIAALPKKKVEKSMMGQDGKAECSVCMDAVDLGDEVTMLPCKHWFHEDCVGAWLKEHDTCPHCRQGIMPKDTPENNNGPRSPDQAPRNIQVSVGTPFRAPPPPTQPYNGGPVQPLPPDTGFPHPNYPHSHVMPGTFAQPGMQHPYVPGGHPGYPEPRNFVTPPHPFPPPVPFSHPPSPHPPSPLSPISPIQQHHQQQHFNSIISQQHAEERARHRRRSSAREHRSSGNGGESNSSGGVTGWFRNLRGSSSDHR